MDATFQLPSAGPEPIGADDALAAVLGYAVGRRELRFRYPRAVAISAATGEGLDNLSAAIEGQFLKTLRPMELLVPYAEGGSLSELHELAGELDREDTASGALIRARVPAGVAQRFEGFEVGGNGAGPDGNGAGPQDAE